MAISRALALAVLIFSVAFTVQTDFGRQEFFLGTGATQRQALIINTWNDFPDHTLIDVDSFPGQALQAYRALKSVGYSDGEITLMVYHTGDDFIDADGDGVNDLDGAAIDYENEEVNLSSLKAELTRIAFFSNESTEVTIYIVAHGAHSGYESAFSFEDGSRISNSEFFSLLAPLNSENLFIFLDFCYSGGFVGDEYPLKGVYVWAASGNNLDLFYWNYKNIPDAEKAVYGEDGSVFFHPFWKAISEGGGVVDAFYYGKSKLLRWQRVDPTVYRQGVDLPLKQDPRIHIENSWLNEVHGLATAMAYTGVSFIGLMLGIYALAMGTTVYRWRRLERQRKLRYK